MIEAFELWADKQSRYKRDLDKMMFDDIISLVKSKEASGQNIIEIRRWLDDSYTKNVGSRMVGPKLLASNAKLVKDKLWSLSQ